MKLERPYVLLIRVYGSKRLVQHDRLYAPVFVLRSKSVELTDSCLPAVRRYLILLSTLYLSKHFRFG